MKTKNVRRGILTTLNVTGNFPITDDLLNRFREAYTEKLEGKETRQNRRLSALSLIKHKRMQGVPSKEISEGFLYIVSNPAWDAFKVGVSLEPRDRLKQYQTASPLRDYKLEGWYFSRNARKLEKELHEKLKDFHVGGEWFKLELEHLRRFLIRKTDL